LQQLNERIHLQQTVKLAKKQFSSFAETGFAKIKKDNFRNTSANFNDLSLMQTQTIESSPMATLVAKPRRIQ